MDMNKVLVIGDSWASAVVCGNPDPRAGWPLIMEIPDGNRQGIAGSTAAEWSLNVGGRLDKAKATPSDFVIVSLLGNDMRLALSDGKLTVVEVMESINHMRNVVAAFEGRRVIVLLYSDPYLKAEPMSCGIVNLLNVTVMQACNRYGVTYANTGLWLYQEHFDRVDIHPNIDGHEAIARGMLYLLSLES